MSSSSSSARLDALLVDFFTAFADSRSVRSELSSLMSDGFYDISLARHESPLLPLDQSSYAGRDMTASTTISHNAEREGAHADEEPIAFCLNRQPAVASTAAVVSASSPIRPAVFTAHLSARERKLDALIAQRGQLNDAIEQQIDEAVSAADMSTSSPPPVPSLQCEPLRWFGLLAPLQLTAAQVAFKHAMERVARLCELQERLRIAEERWMKQLQQVDTARAEERKQAAERWKVDSEKRAEREGDEEAGSELGGAWRRQVEKSKLEGRHDSSRSDREMLESPQRPAVSRAGKDEEVVDSLQSLSITHFAQPGS